MSMNSTFGDALYAQMLAGMDPMNGVIRSLAVQQVKAADINLDDSRKAMMVSLTELIIKYRADGVDDNVIQAFQRMLDKYSQ